MLSDLKYKEGAGHLLITNNKEVALYKLEERRERVSQQVLDMPHGSKMSFEDGAYFLHFHNYLLIRNWTVPGTDIKIDRVALRYSNLYTR